MTFDIGEVWKEVTKKRGKNQLFVHILRWLPAISLETDFFFSATTTKAVMTDSTVKKMVTLLWNHFFSKVLNCKLTAVETGY